MTRDGSTIRHEMTRAVLLAAGLLAVLVGLVAVSRGASLAITLAVVALVGLFLIWRLETIAVLQFLFITIIPIKFYGEQFHFFPIYFNYVSNFIAILGMFGVLSLHKLARGTFGPLVKNDRTGNYIVLFFLWTIFITLRGLAKNYGTEGIYGLLAYIILFYVYFFFRDYFIIKNNHYAWLKFIVLFGGFIAIEYFYLVSLVFTDIYTFVIYRATTSHTYYTLAGIPLALGFLVLTKKRWAKLFWALLLVVFVVQNILGQQRVIWGATVGMLFVFLSLYFFRDSWSFPRVSKYLFMVLMSMFVLVALMMFVAEVLDVNVATFFVRWKGLENLQDASMKMRVFDSRRAIDLVGSQWYWGLGLGALVRSSPRGVLSHFFDQSYLLPYFVGGIPYTVLLVLIYFSGLWNGFSVMRNSNDHRRKIMSISIITSITGQLVAGMTDTTIFAFGYIFIWMILLAAMTMVRIETEEEKRSRTFQPAEAGAQA